MANDPVGYWRLDEIAGDVAADDGPGGYDGQYSGGAGTYQLKQSPAVDTGQSVWLDGVDGFVYVADSWTAEAQALAPEDALSVELWFRPDGVVSDGISHRLARWRWYGWELRVLNGRVYGDVWEGTSVSQQLKSLQGPELTSGEWYHVVLTKDASNVRLYVNGAQVASTASSGDAFYSVVPNDPYGDGGGVGFGRDADVDTGYFRGWLDEVAVYDASLSAADVLEHYEVGTIDLAAEIEAVYGDQPGGVHVSDPVHTGSGSMWLAETDIEIGAQAPLPGFGRSYNSRDQRVGAFGRGWTATFETRLAFDDDDVVYVAQDGRTTRFASDGAGGWLRPEGVFAELETTVSGYELRHHDGTVDTFDGDGNLLSVSDWTTESVTLTRDTAGFVTELAWSTGQELAFTYSAGRLVSAVTDDGRTVTYGYTDGRLSTVTDPSGRTTNYAWTTTGFLKSIEVDGVEEVFNVFDESGRVIEQHTQDGDVTFDYDDLTATTVMTNVETGEALTYVHDAAGRVTSIEDPLGNSVFITLNADGQQTGVIDRAGFNPTAGYDTAGNVTSVIDPASGTTTATYDTLSRVTSVTEPTGAFTTFTYDGNERLPSTVTDGLGGITSFDVVDGLIASMTDADGVTTTFAYDAARRVVSASDELVRTWTYGYDAAGRRTSTTSPLAHTTTMTYDASGRILTSTAADGGVTTYTYDSSGRVINLVDPTGATTANTYDAVTGLLASTTDPSGRVTSYTYDALGQLTAVTANDGGVTETDYGTLGRVTETRDPLGRATTYAYDANGNRTQVVAPDGGATTTEYDPAGRITAVEDPLGRRTENTYDAYGRLVTVTQPDNTTIDYDYDLLGRQTTATGADGGVTTTDYTAAGRIESETDPLGAATTYDYDDAGQLLSISDALGHVTAFGYDTDGRQTTVTTPEGLITATGYDPAGRVTSIADPAGVTTTRTYTLRGELATEQHGTDGTITYTYNTDGTLDTVSDALGNTTTHTYDAGGRLAARTDAASYPETWGYNLAGQLTTSSDRLNRTTSRTYDTAGRLATVSDPSGRSVTYTYDLAGETTGLTYADASTVSFAYDPMGRRSSMTDSTGSTTYDYDDAGRTTQVATPAGSLQYAYDLAGRRTALTNHDGTVLTYGYDSAGHLTSIVDNAGGDVDYAVDDDGNLLTVSDHGTVTRSYTYTNGQPTEHTDHGRTTAITYNGSGRIATLTGADNHTYTYDPAGQLLQAVQDDGTFAYTYGTRGEITSIDDPLGYREFTHNAALELVAMSDGTTPTGTFTYDAAGRGIESTTTDGYTLSVSYNAQGAATNGTLEGPSGVVAQETATYNGDGQPVHGQNLTLNFDSTYIWDSTLSVPQVAGGTVSQWGDYINVFGYELEGTHWTDSNFTWTAHLNALGDVLGDLGQTWQGFSPYGYADGNLPGRGYRGESHAVTNVLLRARYLKPDLGVFATRDPLDGVAGTTTYTNPYHYANNDPINQRDPLGLRPSDYGLDIDELFVAPTAAPITVGRVSTAGLAPLVAAGLAAEVILDYFEQFDLDDLFVQTYVERLYPALAGLDVQITAYTENPFIKDSETAYNDPIECQIYTQAFGPALGILQGARAAAGGIAGNATTAVAVYCIDGKLGGVVARSGSARSSSFPGLAVAPHTDLTADALGSFQDHAETNALATIIQTVPVVSTSSGVIYMAVDNPSSGEICPFCIDAFKSFRSYAPGVSLTVIADRNAWQDGKTKKGSGFLGDIGIDL